MSSTLVQTKTGTYDQAAGGSTSVSATWDNPTTAGNLLLAMVGSSLVAGGSSTYTAPAGWGAVTELVDLASNVGFRLYDITQAASRSGAETFTIAGVARDSTLILAEFSSTNPLILDRNDGTDQTGTSTTITSGSLAPTITADLLRIAPLANRNNSTHGSPTGSFSLAGTQVMSPNATAGNRVNSGLYYRSHNSGAAATCTVALGTSRPWVGNQVIYRELPPNTGSSTGSITRTGSATGDRASSATAAGTITRTGAATGARTSEGAAAGTISRTGTATGSRDSAGTAAGTITRTGAATGARTSEGGASGTIGRTGSATGARDSAGSAAGTINRTGTANGEAPAVAAPEGFATGTITRTATATGARASSGAAAGTIGRAGTATGARASSGAAAGSLTRTGLATGMHHSTGQGAGTITRVGTAVGRTPPEPRDVTVLSITDRSRTIEITDRSRTITVTEKPRAVTIIDRS